MMDVPNAGPAGQNVPAFRQSKETEKFRKDQKRRLRKQAEREQQTSDFLKFSQTLKLKPPMPKDLRDLSGTDPARQEEETTALAEKLCSAVEAFKKKEEKLQDQRSKTQQKIAELKKFSRTFKLRTPMPKDIRDLVGKGPKKGKGQQ